jgi:hypothetical protein
MSHRASMDGVPLVVPLYHVWPREEQAYRHPTQFVFGTQLLVAPITSPADRRTTTGSVRAWLPEGLWVDVLDDLVYDGGRELVLHRNLDGIPVLARAGAIVPLDAAEIPADDPVNPRHLELLVVVGDDGTFDLIEDDGSGDGLDPETIARTPIRFEQAGGRLRVGPVEGALAAVPPARSWTLTFPAADLARDRGEITATVDGVPLPVDTTHSATRTSATVTGVPAGSALVIEIGPEPSLAQNDVPARLFAFLDAAQIEFTVKTQILRIATSGAPLHVRVSHLHGLGLDPALATAVDEILLARAAH